MLWDLQDGPADDPGGPGAPGGGSGDASEAAEPLDTLSDVESDEAEEDKQCAAPAAGSVHACELFCSASTLDHSAMTLLWVSGPIQ